MQIHELHEWRVSPKRAVTIQKDLQGKVITSDDFGEIRHVAGVDVGFDKKSNTGKAAIVVLNFPDLTVCDQAVAEMELEFPYVPGLLSFREMPVILQALDKLGTMPDLFICDGQGIAHPRRFGIACHLGLVTDIPSIGVGKSRLIGSYGDVPPAKGGWTELYYKGEVIGVVLRTRENVHPVFVSPGHRVSLKSAIQFVMQCVTRYKLPETTRKAHNLSSFQSAG